MQITRHSSAVGAEVGNVDLRNLDNDQFAELRAAFQQHGALFFRDQRLTPEQHIAFAERWGVININRFFQAVDGYPQIAQVLKEPDQTLNIGGAWHTDHSYDQEPAMSSILYALEVPPHGGDTLFAGMAAAYDALSDTYKALLAPLSAVHSSRHVFGKQAAHQRAMEDRFENPELATQDSVHPLVIQHPETGQSLLYVNPAFTVRIEGLAEEESNMLLQFLYQHAMNPEFHTRFHWEKGSLAMWDNRATWHYALNDYQGQRRHLHRITIAGSRLSAAKPPVS
jgi:taurine dioxygenase